MTEHDTRANYPPPPHQGYPAPTSAGGQAKGYPMPSQFHPPAPQSSRWNKCSIAAIACSLFSVLAPLGVLLGIIATYQCAQSQQRGRGLAIAAIIIGGVMTILLILANTSGGSFR